MSDPVSQSTTPPNRHHGKWGHRLVNSRFLFVSVGLHLLFGIVAAYLVVQNIAAKRKLTFNAPPPSANPGQRAVEHQVQMAKRRQSMSAPTLQNKRITTTGVSKVALPDMPAMPSLGVVPGRMAAPGGGAVSFGGVAGPIGGGPIPLFGFRGGGKELVGTFYDLKQTPSRQPTDMGLTEEEKRSPKFEIQSPQAMRYAAVLKEFVKTWNPSLLNGYYRAPETLSTPQIFIPVIKAEDAPKAFGVEKEVQARRWIVIYKGKVAAPETGTYRFVGAGDDILLVRIKGINVLDGSLSAYYPIDPSANSKDMMAGPGPTTPLRHGRWFDLSAHSFEDIQIVIGENPGGESSAFLLIERKGAHFDNRRDANFPAYPVFQVRKVDIPKGRAPEVANGSVLFECRPPGYL